MGSVSGLACCKRDSHLNPNGMDLFTTQGICLGVSGATKKYKVQLHSNRSDLQLRKMDNYKAAFEKGIIQRRYRD